MRSMTSAFENSKNEKSTRTFNTLVFDFATPVNVYDGALGVPGDALVKDWGFIEAGNASGVSDVSDFQVTIMNTGTPRFSDNFTDTDPLENVEVCLYQYIFGSYGVTESDILCLFKGYISGRPKYDLYECTLTVRGVWQKYNKKIGADLLVNADDYPGADPDEIGKMLPLVWGDCDRVPFRAVDAGGLTTLAETLDATETSILVTDPDRLPASGTMQIDEEKITYTGKSGNNITGCTRGASGTSAVEHELGAKVAEVQAEYIYLAGCAMNAISNVYIRSDGKDVLIPSAYYTAYTGQTGDEHTDYPGKAVIAFTTFPALYVKVELEVDDSTLDVDDSTLDVDDSAVDVNDTIDVSESGHNHDSGTSEVIAVWKLESAETVAGTPTNPGYVVDGDLITNGSRMDADGDKIKVEKAYYEEYPGTPTHVRACMRAGVILTGGSISFTIMGSTVTVGEADSLSVKKASWTALSTSYDTWSEINAAYGYVEALANCFQQGVMEVWAEIKYTPSDTSSDNAGVSKTGDASIVRGTVLTGGVTLTGTVDLTGNSIADSKIGAQVLVDCEGFKDDGAGTYTGTPGALIERPDHLFKHVLTGLCGFPSGDIDTTTFNAAGTFFNTNNYKFGFCVSSPVMAEDLLLSLAYQCRSRFFVTAYGDAKLIVRDMYAASVKGLDETVIKEDSVSIQRTDTEELFNSFNVYWNKDNGREENSPETYKQTKLIMELASIAIYGQRDYQGTDTDFCFYAITDSNMAEHVARFHRDWHAWARKMPRCGVFLDNIEIEPGDIIDITHTLDSMDEFKVGVLKVIHHLGSAMKEVIDHLELVCVEIGPKS